MDIRAMYEALPPHKQREFDRIYQQAQEVAEGMRAKTHRLEELCQALEDDAAAANERAACDAVGSPNCRIADSI